MPDRNVNPELARTEVYAKQLRAAQRLDICPFCEDGLALIAAEGRIAMLGNYIFAVDSCQPYHDQLGRPPKHHLIFAPYAHRTDMSELSPDEQSELDQMVAQVRVERDIEYGLRATRFGGPEHALLAGRSVVHWHEHLIQPFDGLTAAIIFPVGIWRPDR